MFDRMLFPTDGSDVAATTVETVLEIAATHDSTLHILHVADTKHDSVTRLGTEVVDVLEREGQQIVATVADQAAERGIDHEADVIQGGVHETITAYATEHDIDVIVMPTGGRDGVTQALLGSVTERVIRTSSTPVLTLPPDSAAVTHPFRNLLIPTTGRRQTDSVIELGVDLATAYSATFHALSVVDTMSLGIDVYSEQHVAELEEQATAAVEHATGMAEDASVSSIQGSVMEGVSVSKEILRYIEAHDIDLVVVGTHGRSGVDRYLLGSVSEKIVRSSPVPVLVVPLEKTPT